MNRARASGGWWVCGVIVQQAPLSGHPGPQPPTQPSGLNFTEKRTPNENVAYVSYTTCFKGHLGRDISAYNNSGIPFQVWLQKKVKIRPIQGQILKFKFFSQEHTFLVQFCLSFSNMSFFWCVTVWNIKTAHKNDIISLIWFWAIARPKKEEDVTQNFVSLLLE